MDIRQVTAVLLIVVPIAFNVAFFELGRAFDYPDILREEPDEILRRFAAGGSGLLLRWQALLLSALAMLPLVALLAVVLGAAAGADRAVDRRRRRSRRSSRRSASFAGRSPSRSSRAATSRADGPDAEATRPTVEVVFATLHRLLGVGIGEHLGYLLTGLWTLLVAARSCRPPSFRPGSASRRCRSASPCSSARSSSSARTSATAGRWPARSCRSPTSPGRSG